MKIVTACWIEKSLAEFEYNNGLIYWAEYLKNCLYKNEVFVLVVDGFDRIPKHYIERLLGLNVSLVDASHMLKKYNGELNELIRLTNKYEARCFLRWLLFEDFFGGEKYVHIDMDLYPNRYVNIFKVLDGGLGAIDGCPAINIVSDDDWSKVYRDLLDRYLLSPDKISDYVGFKGNPYRKTVGSDQDLIHAAQASKKLPWFFDRSKIGESFYYSMNPLSVKKIENNPCLYERIDGDDFFDGKRVMFWHLQRDFVNYLGVCYLLEEMNRSNGGDFKVGQIDKRLDPNWGTFLVERLRAESQREIGKCQTFLEIESLMGRPFGSIFKAFSRDFIAKKFIGEGGFRWVFSDRCWYKSGDFLGFGKNF